VLYYLFAKAGLQDYRGLLALVFCCVYVFLGKFIEKNMQREKATLLLFYATSLTFAVLMIPFQFGVAGLSMGWLIEGVLLIVYGKLNSFKPLEKTGWGIYMLCLGSFVLLDIGGLLPFFNFTDFNSLSFVVKYTAITVSTFIVASFYGFIWRKKLPESSAIGQLEMGALALFKLGTWINCWLYLFVQIERLYTDWVPIQFVHYEFYEAMLVASMTIALAYTSMKIPVLYDRMIKYYSLTLYAIGYLICFYITLTIPTLELQFEQNSVFAYISLVVLISFHFLLYFSARDFLIAFIRRQYKSVELYPLIMGCYLLGVLTAFLNVQFHLGDVGLVFSLLYLVLAIAYIMYGFARKYVWIRRLGLGLVLFSTGKLFLFDLSFLSKGSKIFAYFSFGLLLLAISFIYQQVSNRLGAQSHAAEQSQSEI